ncbi:Uma2 family endonuclease [Alienimonas chondri]|uniref:Putative restriction endonuclease domain-containing protein n=1 Tax=Alienimonas chondri TaxID=2681879 RepID=A0ABX1VG80_9PLAN|nr:Uma2 family endonuclease [Alienimonas chondri]NNJ25801.1 hypothetical protein [Alienimonas chondri]
MTAPAATAAPPVERTAAGRRPYRPGLTVGDLHERFGPIPASRVLRDPAPGEATVEDWETANRRGPGLYELIDGTLIEKAASDLSSWIGGEIFGFLRDWVRPRGLGFLHPADGFFDLGDGLRAPDVSFTPAADRPDGLLARGFSDVPPALVVEVLSPGNTPQEMRRKRTVYFAAGVVRVWEIDPETRTATVWRGPEDSASFGEGDAIAGEPVLPGFRLAVSDLFPPA